uniref:Uncharacterized protein n=1 Tax=Eptatretus burgeri TaxID=7764 RepID=A0A8C4R8J3_EPTBU
LSLPTLFLSVCSHRKVKAGRLRTAGALCDVVIAVGTRRFYAHKLVLACVSRTLEALFRQASLRYTLDFLQPSTFQQILDYAYTGCVDVCPDELPRLLQAAQLLQIDCLCTLCFGLARPGASDAVQNDGEPAFDNSHYPSREVESVAPAVEESERAQAYVGRPSTEFSTEQTPSVAAASSAEAVAPRPEDEAALRAHRKAHGRERPHACQVCGKTFTLRHQLKTHYRVHTGEKPFECVLCGQRSRDHSAMTKHLRTHGGAKPYRCSLCRAFYPNMAAMQTHMTSHAASELPADWTIEDTYLYRHHAIAFPSLRPNTCSPLCNHSTLLAVSWSLG